MYEQRMSAEDRIVRQRTKIMNDERFIAMAGIMMIGEWSVRDDIPTAATNGRDVFYGRDFVNSIDDATLRFVILHEYYHTLLMHLIVWKPIFEENRELANYAADMVINNLLDTHAGRGADKFITVWANAALDHQYDGMDTGEVYRALQRKGNSGGNASKSASGTPGKGNTQAYEFDQHDVDGAVTQQIDTEEAKALAEQIDTAIRQGAQIAGKIGANADRLLDGLMEVTVDWREVLQDFVRTHAAGDDMSTWRRLSRRWMSRDIKMPSRYSESAKSITIGIDTSGSIGDEQLRRALSEIKGACDSVNPERVDVIYWDAEVAGHETYEGDTVQSIADVTKPRGGGGTRVGCMVDYMRSRDIKPDCIIVFTDGYVESDWGGTAWPAPVLWCVSTKQLTAPTGKTLYVPA